MAVQRAGSAELLVDAAGGAYPDLILKIRASSQCVGVQFQVMGVANHSYRPKASEPHC